jgi:RNA polymerase sigma factor (TIGR02999 family)
MSDVTEILQNMEAGQPQAPERLLPLVYEELRRIAAAKMAAERPGQTLDATGLVHEAYLRLLGPNCDARFANRRHFFIAAAEAMRRILVENARRKHRLKHGGQYHRVELTDQPGPAHDENLVALDAALEQLAQEDPLAAKVVELRQFAGLGHEQIAETLVITIYQARQKWTYARAWLRTALEK